MQRLRDELQAFLKAEGVGTDIYYPLSLHEQECFRSLGYKADDCPAVACGIQRNPGIAHLSRAYGSATALCCGPYCGILQRGIVCEGFAGNDMQPQRTQDACLQVNRLKLYCMDFMGAR